MKVNGGEAVYQVLVANGIETVFGLLGGSMLELYDAIYRNQGLRYVGARDERAAAHMADAYARVSGQVGVVLGAQSGPGVANLVTGVTEAQLAYSPLVAIAGMTTRDHQGRDTFQEFDQVSLFKSISKQSIMVPSAERLPEMLTDAIRLANSGRKGAVVLHVPRDLFAETFDMTEANAPSAVSGAAPTRSQLEQIKALLAGAHAPVLFAGGGFKWSRGSAALRSLAETLNLPVIASTGHADIMPHDHPLYAGQAGPRGNTVASGLTRDADLILAIGNRLAFNSTFHVTLGIQADARASAEALVEACAAHGGQWQAWLERFHADKAALLEQRQAEASDASMPLLPTRVLGEIRETLPRDAIATIDTGNACLQAADRLAHYQCPGLVAPLDFGLVGFAYAAALGAQAAAPERPVVAIMGDGGFGFTMAEITTAVQYQLPVIAVVIDNGAWGAEKAYQNEFFGGRLLGAEIESPDYAALAELCGAAGYRVDKPGEMSAALNSALQAGKPAVIHVKVDPDALSALRKDLFKKN